MSVAAVIHFQPSLIFSSLPEWRPIQCHTLRVGRFLALLANVRLGWKWIRMIKHSSLSWFGLNYDCKKFYETFSKFTNYYSADFFSNGHPWGLYCRYFYGYNCCHIIISYRVCPCIWLEAAKILYCK